MKKFAILIVLVLTVFALYGSEADTMDSTIILYEDMEQVKKLAEEKPTVLFFKANWCPSCKSAAKDFDANVDKLKDIYLVVVNYDHSEDLKVKYGVTYQHTFVQIGPEGNALTKWNGGKTSELLKKIVKGQM